jgi:hypothetical protein
VNAHYPCMSRVGCYDNTRGQVAVGCPGFLFCFFFGAVRGGREFAREVLSFACVDAVFSCFALLALGAE